ncbi:hypothetical protein [Endozoicomonas atrinae]|uniref:hypothetical protein n=1 Tax=Endozoicomonas atrinae TaxID=1333660 RepID=UPI000825E50D|nr:hypothetical protein [Endozoicomonas atrinae]
MSDFEEGSVIRYTGDSIHNLEAGDIGLVFHFEKSDDEEADLLVAFSNDSVQDFTTLEIDDLEFLFVFDDSELIEQLSESVEDGQGVPPEVIDFLSEVSR